MPFESPFLDLLRDRINLSDIPFSERGSRLMVFRSGRGLAVRLAERWFKVDQKLSGYRQRPPLLDAWTFTDGDGQALDLEPSTWPHRVDLATRAGLFSLVFVDPETLMLRLPPGRSGLSFTANLDKSQTDRRGGILRLTGDIRRNLAYTTNARLENNSVTALGNGSQSVRLTFDGGEGGRVLLLNITPRLGFNRYIPDPLQTVDAAARRWHDWFAAAPPVAGRFQAQYYYAWWVMRAGLISTRFYTTREAMTPSKVHYVGVWQWDAYFHALAYRHVEPRLAQDQLRVMLDHQRDDGLIPDALHDEGVVTHLTFPVDADVTKPPLLGWAAWKLYELDGDREFLDEVYEPIVRWNNWWFEKNDLDGDGLCEYQHPFSSGLDDSPLWDGGMPVTAPDLNTYLCLQLEALSRIAEVLGQTADAARWAQQADALADRMLKHLWDPEAGLFWAQRGGQPIEILTPFSLFPLITGRLPAEITARLAAHLVDENEFWTRFPVPTVARSDPHYDPQTMWRGPAWANVNYLLVEGLERSGYPELARRLRVRSLEMLMGSGDLHEYYHPETGQSPPKAAPVFGWSAALYIEMAIRESQLLAGGQPGRPDGPVD